MVPFVDCAILFVPLISTVHKLRLTLAGANR